MSEMSRELLALGFGPRGRFVFGGWAGTRGLVEGGRSGVLSVWRGVLGAWRGKSPSVSQLSQGFSKLSSRFGENKTSELNAFRLRR
jgi:hypothetical protein